MDSNFEPLTKDQELELINAFKAGNEEIFDQLVFQVFCVQPILSPSFILLLF